MSRLLSLAKLALRGLPKLPNECAKRNYSPVKYL